MVHLLGLSVVREMVLVLRNPTGSQSLVACCRTTNQFVLVAGLAAGTGQTVIQIGTGTGTGTRSHLIQFIFPLQILFVLNGVTSERFFVLLSTPCSFLDRGALLYLLSLI